MARKSEVNDVKVEPAGNSDNRSYSELVPTSANPKLRMSGLIDIEVETPPGYCPRNFSFWITDKLAKKFTQLRDALHTSGAIFDDGNGTHHVDSDADVFRWWIASLEVESQHS